MTKVTMECKACRTSARRQLANVVARRGVKETPGECAVCPKCRQPMTQRKEVHKNKHAGKKGKRYNA